MRKINSAILLSIIGMFNPDTAMSSLLFKTLPSNNTKKVETNNNKKVSSTIPKAEAPKNILNKLNAEQSEESIRSTLKKYELILSREKKIENIISIEFNRIVCFIQLARIIRIKSGGKNIIDEESLYLKKALNTIDQLLKYKNLPPKFISQLYFFQGNSYLDLGLKEKSRDSFEKSITIFEDSTFVPSLSLYLADLYYDDGDLNKAITGYRRFYKRMEPGEKDLSTYKVAWVLLNQSRIEQSIDLFLSLVSFSKSKSIVQDSILSLTVSLGENHNQDFVLKKIDSVEMSEENRLKILIGSYNNFLNQPNLPRQKLWERILKSKTQDDEVLKLITTEVEYMEVNDKLPLEISQIISIKKYLMTNNDVISKTNKSSLVALGQGLERVISKSLERYQKDKSKNSFIMLRLSIDSYLGLNVFDRQLEVAGLLLDLLNERPEEAPLLSFCKEILGNPKYVSLRDKAKLIFLLKIEEKYLAEPKKYQDTFFNLIRRYISSNKVEQWESVSLKFYDYLLKSNLNAEAETVIVNLYKANPNEEYFFKLITIKFEQNKCSEILLILDKRKTIDEKLLDYKRECSLKVAQESKNDQKTFPFYQKNILEFISLSEGSKKYAAIADYLVSLENLVKDKNNAKYEADLKNLLSKDFYQYRYEAEIFPIYQRAILNSMEKAEFFEAQYYLRDCSKAKICSSFNELDLQLNFLQSLENPDKIGHETMDKLSPGFHGYLSLVNPEMFLKIFSKQNDGANFNPLFHLIAARLSAVDWQDQQNIVLYKKVESHLSKDEKNHEYSPLWNQFIKISIPETEGRNKLKDKDIMLLMNKVQKSREALLSELANFSINGQKSILNKAIQVELRMANAIKLSPIPKGLEASKIADYDKGLNDLAQEFVLQADSYKVLITNIDQQESAKKDQPPGISDELIIPVNLEQWDFGKSSYFSDKVKGFINKDNYVQALFYLDYLLSTSKINKDDYYLNRSAVLLNSASKRNKSAPMIRYVVNECELNEQSSLLNNWRERSLKK